LGTAKPIRFLWEGIFKSKLHTGSLDLKYKFCPFGQYWPHPGSY
jgi:hypothetical protein